MKLRERIDCLLKTDADLEAFCIDRFPHISNRFSHTMERILKVNLLLQLASEEELTKALDEIVAQSTTEAIKFKQITSSTTEQTKRKRTKRFMFIFIIATIPIIGIAFLAADTSYSRRSNRQKEEYRKLLEFRANEIKNALAGETELQNHFQSLHKQNMEAIQDNELILSHEITGRIRSFIERHINKRTISDSHDRKILGYSLKPHYDPTTMFRTDIIRASFDCAIQVEPETNISKPDKEKILVRKHQESRCSHKFQYLSKLTDDYFNLVNQVPKS